jgi:phospholipid/cholesterol/gamma-HCH transport system permease protein
VPDELPAPGATAGALLHIDGTAVQHWDAGAAAGLWALAARWRAGGGGVALGELPPGLRHLLELAGAVAPAAAVAPVAASAPPLAPPLASPRPAPPPQAPDAPGAATDERWPLPVFIGAVLIAGAAWARGRGGARAAGLLRQLDATGPRSLPIVLLACALVGLMLAYMGGAQLARIGAQHLLADVVAVGMVRELGAMMAGILLAGRVGSAFAAQLATMKAGEEIDALRALGVDPLAHLVLPRVLALLLAGPVLVALGSAAGILAGWPAATLVYGVGSAEYLHQALRAITGTHLWIGLFKGQLYMLLVALAGCRAGLAAGRSAEAVGAATTRAVVHALVWIVAAASGTTVVFTALGY